MIGFGCEIANLGDTLAGWPGDPITYSCMWPESKEVQGRFVGRVEALAKCTGGKADLSLVNEYGIADVTVTLRGVEYHTSIANDFLGLDVRKASLAWAAARLRRRNVSGPIRRNGYLLRTIPTQRPVVRFFRSSGTVRPPRSEPLDE